MITKCCLDGIAGAFRAAVFARKIPSGSVKLCLFLITKTQANGGDRDRVISDHVSGRC